MTATSLICTASLIVLEGEPAASALLTAPSSPIILEEKPLAPIVESPHVLKQSFEQQNPEEPAVLEPEGYITPLSTSRLEFQQCSAGASSLRTRHSSIYPPKVEESVLQLYQLLQQESFTKDFFVEMMTILERFEENCSLWLWDWRAYY